MAAAEVKKEGGSFFQKLFSVEKPLKYGILGGALAVGIALLKVALTAINPALFTVMEAGAIVGGTIGIVNNLASAAAS